MAACTTNDVGGPCPVPRTACPGRAPGTAVVLRNSIYDRSAAPLGSSGRWKSRSRSWLSRRALACRSDTRGCWLGGTIRRMTINLFSNLATRLQPRPEFAKVQSEANMTPAHLSQQLQCRFDVLVGFCECQIRRPCPCGITATVSILVQAFDAGDCCAWIDAGGKERRFRSGPWLVSSGFRKPTFEE